MGSLLVLFLFLIIVLMFTNLKLVNSDEVYIVERMGQYYATWHGGIHIKFPFIDKIKAIYRSNEVGIDIVCLEVNTKDNVLYTIKANTLVKIEDYYKYTYKESAKYYEGLISDEIRYAFSQYLSNDIKENLINIKKEMNIRIHESQVLSNIGMRITKIDIEIM